MFVRQEAATKHDAGRKMPGVAVRACLRFLVCGGARRPGLEATVPTPRQWTPATLPPRLTAEAVERVLATHPGERPGPAPSHHPDAPRPPGTAGPRRGVRRLEESRLA